MRNIDRFTKYIVKYGAESILIHTIYGTKNWIICQKIGVDLWHLILCDPMGFVTYNLGTVTSSQHLELWIQLTRMEIETKANQILIARDLKKRIYNFKNSYKQRYKKFIRFTRHREKKTRKSRNKINKK